MFFFVFKFILYRVSPSGFIFEFLIFAFRLKMILILTKFMCSFLKSFEKLKLWVCPFLQFLTWIFDILSIVKSILLGLTLEKQMERTFFN